MPPRELHERVVGLGQIIQVPGVVRVRCLSRRQLLPGLPLGEAAAELASWHICGVLDPSDGPHLVLDHVPVVLFQLVILLLASQWMLMLGCEALEFCEGPPCVVLFEALAL